MTDTVQPEACFSFNLRISDLLVQLQNLFVFLFLVRHSLRLKNKVLKEQTAKGCQTEHLLSKERSRDLSLSSKYQRHFAQAQISQGGQGAASLTLVRDHISCLMMGCRREGKGQTQILNCSCFSCFIHHHSRNYFPLLRKDLIFLHIPMLSVE